MLHLVVVRFPYTLKATVNLFLYIPYFSHVKLMSVGVENTARFGNVFLQYNKKFYHSITRSVSESKILSNIKLIRCFTR